MSSGAACDSICDILTEYCGLPPISSRIVSDRVGDLREAACFFSRNLADLNSPFLFRSIALCVSRLAKAIAEKEKVMIFSDRDADGLCSLSLVNDFLKSKGLRPILRIPEDDAGCGISRKDIDDASSCSVALLILLDCGSSQAEEISYASGLGIDVMVLDHHLVSADRRPNCLIVNPKDSGDAYPFPHLSACAVCSKLIWAFEYSMTGDYDSELIFADACHDGAKIVLETVFMRNFVAGVPEKHVFDSLDELDDSEFCRQNGDRIVFVLDDNDIFRRLCKHMKVLSLKAAIGKYFNDVRSLNLRELSERNRPKTIGKRPVEILAWYYKRYYLRSHPRISSDWISCLDLVAVSSIADMVPLRGENLVLVSNGIAQLNKRRRGCFLGILSAKRLCERILDEKDIAMDVVPVVNAPWRMGHAEIGLKLFSETNLNMLDIYSREALEANERRRSYCRSFLKFNGDGIRQSYDDAGGSMVFVVSDELLHGLTGLVANALKDEYGCPAVAVSAKDGRVTGSLRMDGRAMEALGKAKAFLSDYGGHFSAAGFSIASKDMIPRFLSSVLSFVRAGAGNDPVRAKPDYDLSVPSDGIPCDIFEQLEMIGPFGHENEIPRLRICGMRADLFSMIKGKENPHLQAMVSISGVCAIQFMFWNKGAMLREIGRFGNVDVIAMPRKSYVKGRCKRYFEILDIPTLRQT